MLPAFLIALAACRRADVDALWQLYETAGGAKWTHHHNWSPSGDPCGVSTQWSGVGAVDPCDRWLDGEHCYFGRVTSVYLDSNRLNGSLDAWTQVGALSNLTYLDLSWNSLHGYIPSELGRINNLQTLLVAHNELSGTLPSELGAISTLATSEAPRLREISFAHNRLSGSLPSSLGVHTELASLDLRSNRLTGGGIPTELGTLTRLASWHMQDNARLGGTLPDTVGGLSELRYLDLSRTGLSGTLPSTLDMPLLQALHAAANRLSGSIPDTITGMGSLRTLRLADNLLVGNLPAAIGKLSHLQVLDVYNNSMDGDVPASVRDLLELKELYLAHEHLKPLRKRYCGQRLPNLGKYSYRMVRDEYDQMMASYCPEDEMRSTQSTFSRLQDLLPPNEL